MPSARPLSSASATLGAATVVSSVKASSPDGAEMFPATSVCRTIAGAGPAPLARSWCRCLRSRCCRRRCCTARRPGLQAAHLTVALLVMSSCQGRCRSPAPRLGAAAVGVEREGEGGGAETLPATSVCRTSTVLAPCASCAAVGALVLQLLPPSIEYSTLAPALDAGQRQRGVLVIVSLPEEPVSLASATPGAAGAVSSTVRA